MDKRLLLAIDLDKTYAYHTSGQDLKLVGDPIPEMVKQVKRWVDMGHRYLIFTARASESKHGGQFVKEQKEIITEWLLKHKLPLPILISSEKTSDIDYFVDDKSLGVIPNTGIVRNLPEELK